jgi:hypothetical protein
MTGKSRLAAAFAFGAGLTAASLALAQTQAESSTPPAIQPVTPTPQASPWAQPDALTLKPWDPNSSQPTYSVDPPPDGPSGVYLPAAVLGYTKSAVGCVVIGCEDGPQAGGATGPAASAPAEPQPPNPGPSDRH